MTINSKRKGNSFELKISKLLTSYTGFKWYRVGVSSGARFTTIGAEKYIGDVTTDNLEYTKYVIECKATKSRVTLEDLYNKNSKINEWIVQCERESNNRDWILFFKANNGKIFALEKVKNEFCNKFFKEKILIFKDEYHIFVIDE